MSGSKVKLHCLDTGFPRPTQFSVVLVLEGKADIERLQSCWNQLVQTWPILSSRLGIRRDVLHLERNIDEIAQFKYSDLRLEDVLQSEDITSQELRQEKREALELLFRFHQPLKSLVFSPALTMKVVLLQNGTMFKFTAQHSLCHASGLYRIISAYTTLLKGEKIAPVSSRPMIELKQPPPTDKEKQANNIYELAKLHGEQYGLGFLRTGHAALRMACCTSSKSHRIIKTAKIPSSLIDASVKEGAEIGVKVTRNDILMATIFKAARESKIGRTVREQQGIELPFSFVLGIEKALQETTELHNPWCAIRLPPIPDTTEKHKSLLELAIHMRQTIIQARDPACLNQIIQQHEDIGSKLFHLTDSRKDPALPRLFITSWGDLPLYDLGFSLEGTSVSRPVYIEPSIALIDLYRAFNINIHDVLITWVDRDQNFYVHGSLHEDIWAELERYTSN